MTATCSVDGRVKLRRAGTSVRCAVAAATAQKRWTRQNPDKAQANRRSKTEHVLTDRDRKARTARCSKCGPVDLVAYGRGFTCGNRARELRGTQQPEPQQFCHTCFLEGKRVWLGAKGECVRCADPEQYVYRAPEKGDPGRRNEWALQMVDGFHYEGDPEPDPDERYGSGYSFGYGVDDPAYMDGYESAVPGWKTLGSTEPWDEVS